ncbi:MD-2-related lipid-recognition domain [Arabidopsis thaliana x Arabidopsis arenosa]|uniref:MD-2-related lipid-recognition domain n=1 Tax=Arabidopsis thaliana x Arabidopsis arenosa TaxID=1240361 RepID=A0A8T2A6C1_9BRAS|nr:MD-2-related lipid-recognition domain [Arabidopsis thaliana x Arabidopsis arenosa]
MAMSNVQPLLLLVASLFFLPALHGAIDFEYCGKNGNDYGTVNRIQISQNPSVGPEESSSLTIYVYGSASKNITVGTLVYVTFKDGEFTGLLKTYNLCDVSACNTEAEIEAGTNFLLTLPEVLYVGFDEELKYSVSLRQKYVDEPIINMCVDFKVPTPSASTLFSA